VGRHVTPLGNIILADHVGRHVTPLGNIILADHVGRHVTPLGNIILADHVGRHVTPLGNIFLIRSQAIFALTFFIPKSHHKYKRFKIRRIFIKKIEIDIYMIWY
jgi:hypothetical protein